MKALQVLGTIILGFLLLLSLVVLGPALTINSTLLNPNFVVREVKKVNLPDVIEQVVEQNVSGQLTPEEELIKDAALRVVREQQAWLSEQLEGAIRAGYDFFLGRTDSLKITVPLSGLKQDLKDSIWQSMTDNPQVWIPAFQSDLNAFVDQNFSTISPSVRPYLPPDIAALPDQELKAYLDKYLPQVEAELTSLSVSSPTYELILTVARPYFDDYYDQLVAGVPDEETFDAATLPADVMANLEKAREYIAEFRLGYYGLIALAVVMAGGIVLIWRRVRPSCLSLGIVLLVAGGLELAGGLFARGVMPPTVLAGIPASVNLWINGFYLDVLRVFLIYSACLLAAGLALLAASFIYRPSETD